MKSQIPPLYTKYFKYIVSILQTLADESSAPFFKTFIKFLNETDLGMYYEYTSSAQYSNLIKISTELQTFICKEFDLNINHC